MSTIKRFAFVPLLVVICIWLGWALTDNRPVAGWIVAAVLFVPSLIVWDRRRQFKRQRKAGS